MAARLRNTENNVEADFSDRQQMCLSQIHYESTQAREAQRRALVREAAEDVYRRDAVSNEIVFRLRDEQRQHQLHAESYPSRMCEQGF